MAKRQLTILTFIVLCSISSGGSGANKQDASNPIRSCAKAVLTRPGIGPKYRGLLTNSDYRFTADIPAPLTGWGGVADEAPFHGFTIFLDKSARACIIFEIHIRVDGAYPAYRKPQSSSPISLGNATAWQIRSSGTVNDTQIENIITTFSNRQRNSEIDDGSVELITPASHARDSEQTYLQFLQHLRFW
jgi:hypothetical protein